MDTLFEKKERLARRLRKNFSDYEWEVLKWSKQDMFKKAYEIADCQTVYEHMRHISQYDEPQLDYLLKFENPLELVTDHYKQDIRVDLDALIHRICDTQDLLNDYPLMPDNKQHEAER